MATISGDVLYIPKMGQLPTPESSSEWRTGGMTKRKVFQESPPIFVSDKIYIKWGGGFLHLAMIPIFRMSNGYYPLVNIQKTSKNYGKSPFLMRKSTFSIEIPDLLALAGHWGGRVANGLRVFHWRSGSICRASGRSGSVWCRLARLTLDQFGSGGERGQEGGQGLKKDENGGA